VAALVVSGLATVVAAIGTLMANRRANEALSVSREAVTMALWSAVQEAVQHLIGFDPTIEPVGDRLTNLRITMIDLADHYTDWEGLDRWLEAERMLGATLARQVMDAAKPDDSAERRLENLDPLLRWAQAFSQNLRRFRAKGYDKQVLVELERHAGTTTKDIRAHHGWEGPAATNPHISPLD